MPKPMTMQTPAAVVPSFRIVADNPATWPKVGTVYAFEVVAPPGRPAGQADLDPRTGELAKRDETFRMSVLDVSAVDGELMRIEITKGTPGATVHILPIVDWNERWAPHVQESRLAEPETVDIGPVPAAAADIAVEPDLPDRQAGDVGLVPRLGIVDINRIVVGDDARLRRSFDETALVQLGESMSGLGQLQPIVVNRVGGAGAKRFTLIAGERRLKAAVAARATTIEAKVFCNLTDRQIADMRLAENLDRKDLTHVEVAAALARASEAGETVAQLAGRIHKSDDFVREHLRLMALCPAVLDLVDSGELPSKQAAVIARLTDPDEQIKVAARALGAWAVKKTKKGWVIETPMGMAKSLAEVVAKGAHKVLTIGGVADEVAGKLGDLAGAGAEWPKDIEYAKRPACGGCEHNSATSPALFADAAVSAAGSGGHCADKACFQAKRRAWAKDPANAVAARKKKAAKKVRDKAAGGGGAVAKERSFPDRPAEHLAVLQWAYGVELATAIGEWADKADKAGKLPADATQVVASVLAATNDVDRRGEVQVVLDVKAVDRMGLTAALQLGEPIEMPRANVTLALEGLDLRCRRGPAWDRYGHRAYKVPLPVGDLAALDILQVLGARWRVPTAAELVRPDRKAAWFACRTAIAEGWTAKITGVKKADDVIAAIKECDDVGALGELAKDAKGLGGKFVAAINDRIEELAKRAIPIVDMSRPDPPRRAGGTPWWRRRDGGWSNRRCLTSS